MSGQALNPNPSSTDAGSSVTGTGCAFGSFGELLQGVLPGGDSFLATLPIRKFSHARFTPEPCGPLRVIPPYKTKSRRLAESMLDAHGAHTGGLLALDSDIPIGKGLASSSADLVAAARAIGNALGMDTSSEAVEYLLRPIEPTDGVMYPGTVVFDQRAVRLRSSLGVLPPTTIVAVDEGGLLETVEFGREVREYSQLERAEYSTLLDALTEAVRKEDLATIGIVATRSAILNQRFVPKRNLDAVLRIAREAGAAGVVCAHSGTMLGILFDRGDPRHREKVSAARIACEDLPASTSVMETLSIEQPIGGEAVPC